MSTGPQTAWSRMVSSQQQQQQKNTLGSVLKSQELTHSHSSVLVLRRPFFISFFLFVFFGKLLNINPRV